MMKKMQPILGGPLQDILQAELGRGNRILSIADWPPKCPKLVVLSRPFGKKYKLVAGLTFAKVNDPHYWKEEYNWQVGPEEWECLACGF